MSARTPLEKEDFLIRLQPDEVGDLLTLLEEIPTHYLTQKIQAQLEAQSFFAQPETEEEPMNYSRFTSLAMIEELAIISEDAHDTPAARVEIVHQNLFPEVNPVPESDWLQEAFRRAKYSSMSSEKARSEKIVSPMLLELQDRNPEKFITFSGERFDVNKELGLVGACDVLLSYTREPEFIKAPVFALVEAKRKDVDEGLAQCAAQMMAAREFNQQKNRQLPAIFGGVTTGEIWQFLKLEGHQLIIDDEKYYLKHELRQILGILQAIVDFFEEYF